MIPLLQAEDSPYSRFIMRVPGFGSSANSYNSFIIIALLDDWKNRKKEQQIVLREAIGKIVTLPQALAFPISPQSIRVSNYNKPCLLYTSPSPRDQRGSRMPSSA